MNPQLALAVAIVLISAMAAYGLVYGPRPGYQPVPVYHRAGCPQHIGHRTLTNSVYTEADYQQAKLTCFYDIPQEGK